MSRNHSSKQYRYQLFGADHRRPIGYTVFIITTPKGGYFEATAGMLRQLPDYKTGFHPKAIDCIEAEYEENERRAARRRQKLGLTGTLPPKQQPPQFKLVANR